MLNKNIKIAYIVIGVYMLLSFVLPYRRMVVNWTEEQAVVGQTIFYGQLPTLLLIGLVATLLLRFPNSRIERTLNKVVVKTLVPLTCVTLTAFMILTVMRVPGQWWTWQTLGMHIAAIVLIALLLKSKLTPTKALTFGIGCVLIAVGIWEMIYQTGLYYYWLKPQGIALSGLTWQLQLMSPFALIGILIVYNYNHVYHILRSNYLTWTLSLLFVGAFVYWFLSGFWCDVLWDAKTNLWYLNPITDNLSMMAYRSSKVWLNLIFASACTSAPMLKIFNRELCLQLGHCKKGGDK